MRHLALLTFSVFVLSGQAGAVFVPPSPSLGGGAAYTMTYQSYSSRSAAESNAVTNSNGLKQIFEYKTVDANNNIVTAYYTYSFTPNRAGTTITNTLSNRADPRVDFVGLTYASGTGGVLRNNGNNYKIQGITGDFIGNYLAGGARDVRGAAIYNYITTTNKVEIGDIHSNFIGNYLYNPTKSNAQLQGATILNRVDYGTAKIGNITGDFIGNFVKATTSNITYADNGGIQNYSQFGGTAIIGNITGNFIGNYVDTVYTASRYGALYSSAYIGGMATIGDVRGDFIANYSKSEKNYAISGAVGMTATSGPQNNARSAPAFSLIKSLNGNFIGNYAQGALYAHGGAVYMSTSSNQHEATATINFVDDIAFIGNYVQADNLDDARGAAIYARINREDASVLTQGLLNFTLSAAGQRVLFLNNYATDGTTVELNSVYFDSVGLADGSPEMNFTTVADSYVDIRDPLKGKAGIGIVNFSGAGALSLWGDNSDYTGEMNINGGKFYLRFDGADAWAQRHTATLAATTSFASGTVFLPQITSTELANVTGAITADTSTLFMPYGISALDAGNYTYLNRNYEAFAKDATGFISASDLSTLSSDGTNTYISVRDMKGYQKLGPLVDDYRKQSNLTDAQRYELDYIYITGIVSDEIQEQFEILAGKDYSVYEQVHRSSVRKYSRQVASRIAEMEFCGFDGAACPEVHDEECTDGCADTYGHLWFDATHNRARKKRTELGLGYAYQPTGFAIGYDYDFIPDVFTMGVAGSYGFGKAKSVSEPYAITYKDDLNEYFLSFYGKYQDTRPYLSWNIGAGLLDNDIALDTATIHTKGDYNTYAFFANTELGYTFGSPCGRFEPYIGVEWTRLISEKFDETGLGAARHFDRMHWDTLEVPIGARVTKDFDLDDYILTPTIDIAYARNVGDTYASTNVYFLGNPSAPWEIKASKDSRNSYRGNLSVALLHMEMPFVLRFGYALDYRSDYLDQQFYATFGWDF